MGSTRPLVVGIVGAAPPGHFIPLNHVIVYPDACPRTNRVNRRPSAGIVQIVCAASPKENGCETFSRVAGRTVVTLTLHPRHYSQA